ncbi:MAG: phospholipase C, phosphocholine-specific [Bryobacterales bacterium]|nr:phospholipase C, phosphocholine-specific [Bryobacterales bacterium]
MAKKSGNDRRSFLKSALRTAGAVAAISTLPPSIQRALAIPAARKEGTIQDVKHIVILMQENRSFDHYFGVMRGVRGLGDPRPIPLESGKPVWYESDGETEIPPYHLDTKTTSAIKVPGTPHGFPDSQAAWNQGKFGYWPRYKTKYSMGYYAREDIPFQYALAESFTICDAYHCSITTGTDPNRIVFWSGSNFNPELRARGENCTDADSEPNNLRCWVKGKLPEPGYTYQGSAFRWPTLPDVLEAAGVSWRIYQDPNNNWTGAMHGCLAFESFREAKPGSAIYEKGMREWTLEQLARDVMEETLPQVSWVLPPAEWSEHPSASTPLQGAEFTARVLDALTANPEVFNKTVFLLTFDENDGQFDHIPAPALPSYRTDGSLVGASTVDIRGEYFHDPSGKYRDPEDTISGEIRPWGLGARVPLYVVSPWSKGGWVNSQVFDHTSVGLFLEKRFGVHIPAISPWHRAICGDLTSAFDFVNPNKQKFPKLPDVSDSKAKVEEQRKRPKPDPPAVPVLAQQERGVRPSRALPYVLHVRSEQHGAESIMLRFENDGEQGAVFHVYDRLHLRRIPRRYTVEPGKSLRDEWNTKEDAGRYHFEIFGPNGFYRELRGAASESRAELEASIHYDPKRAAVAITVENRSDAPVEIDVDSPLYESVPNWSATIAPRSSETNWWTVGSNGNWYDLRVRTAPDSEFLRSFGGRIETGAPATTDPAMGA